MFAMTMVLMMMMTITIMVSTTMMVMTCCGRFFSRGHSLARGTILLVGRGMILRGALLGHEKAKHAHIYTSGPGFP